MLKVVRLLCVVIAIVCTLGAISLAAANRTLYDEDFYSSFADEETVTLVKNEIVDAVSAESAYYGIDAEYFTKYIDEDEIKTACNKYYINLGECFKNGKTPDKVEFSGDCFMKGLTDFEKTLDENEFMAPEAKEEITSELVQMCRNQIVLTSDKVIAKATEITANEKLQKTIQSWYILAAAALLFAVLTVVIPKAPIWSRTMYASASLMLPSLFMLIFTRLFAGFGIKEKIALAESTLKIFFDRALDETIYTLTVGSAVILAVSGIVFILSAVMRIKKK